MTMRLATVNSQPRGEPLARSTRAALRLARSKVSCTTSCALARSWVSPTTYDSNEHAARRTGSRLGLADRVHGDSRPLLRSPVLSSAYWFPGGDRVAAPGRPGVLPLSALNGRAAEAGRRMPSIRPGGGSGVRSTVRRSVGYGGLRPTHGARRPRASHRRAGGGFRRYGPRDAYRWRSA